MSSDPERHRARSRLQIVNLQTMNLQTVNNLQTVILQTVMTTLPRARPSSWYLTASGISAKG
ncbi:hypothetical protein HNP84_005468 [Thermocatellispora tengchongensis]|uniref:Uncharacterized protein n=1 Tax=Thermocatellispora tengchongensis TaxID=1073253 RepID=A0A840P362_9ACTN|nr:hypothetical protein [Thermocatellispora tengchongensis]